MFQQCSAWVERAAMLLNMTGVVRPDVGMRSYLSIHTKQLCGKGRKSRLTGLAHSAHHERGV